MNNRVSIFKLLSGKIFGTLAPLSKAKLIPEFKHPLGVGKLSKQILGPVPSHKLYDFLVHIYS